MEEHRLTVFWFQFHLGLIKGSPQPSPKGIQTPFQFHLGLIKGFPPAGGVCGLYMFQFHLGLIKGRLRPQR